MIMEYLQRMRHSCSHVLAQAVVELFPGTKLGIGPTIKDGFYYDFDCPHNFSRVNQTACRRFPLPSVTEGYSGNEGPS